MNWVNVELDRRVVDSSPESVIPVEAIRDKKGPYVLSPEATIELGRQMMGHQRRKEFLEGPDGLASEGIPTPQVEALQTQIRTHSAAYEALADMATIAAGAEVVAFPTAAQPLERMAA